jgi:hypothetical protein
VRDEHSLINKREAKLIKEKILKLIKEKVNKGEARISEKLGFY